MRKHDAEKFFDEELKNEKIKVHSSCVIECCLGMALESNLDKEIFVIAGWIHDMGQKISKDNHEKLSLNYLDKFLNSHKKYKIKKFEIADCILNHRTTGKPVTIYGLIFRAADKAAKHKLRSIKWKLENKIPKKRSW